MPAKGRTPNPPPRRRPRVAGLHQPTRPTASDPLSQDDATPPRPEPMTTTPAVPAEPVIPAVTEQWADEAPAEQRRRPEPEPEPGPEPPHPAERLDVTPAEDTVPAAGEVTMAEVVEKQVIPQPAGGRRLSGALLVVVLLLVTVVGGAAAVVFRGQAARAGTGSADNLAVVDTAATGEAVGQVSKAIETVLSYDYTRLDENEEAGRAVITGRYADEFGTTFADVRKTAPEQKLVLTTTVLLAGVTMLGADRAELIATMDLAAMRDTTPYNSPGRVKVVANKVDGRWKIAEMTLL